MSGNECPTDLIAVAELVFGSPLTLPEQFIIVPELPLQIFVSGPLPPSTWQRSFAQVAAAPAPTVLQAKFV